MSTFSRIAEPSAPDWQKKPARPRGGISGDSEALSETVGVGVDDAERVGADQPQAVGAGQPDQLAAAARRPSSPVSAKPDEITTRPCTPLAAQSSTTSCDGLGRHRDDRDVDVVGDVADRLVRRQPGHRVRRSG